MAGVPIQFIGFLANVDDSIKGLKMGDGFAVERGSKNDISPFLKKIEEYRNGTAVGVGFGRRVDYTLRHEEDHVALSAVQESCLGPQDRYPVFGLPWPI